MASTMWEWQRAFRALAQGDARELFSQLSDKLKPSILLVGVPTEKAGPLKVALEPARPPYLPEALAGVQALAGELEKENSPPLLIENPRLIGDHAKQAIIASIKRALETKLEPLDKAQGLVSFCSLPQQVKAHLVLVVLQLSKEAYLEHHRPAGEEYGGVPNSLLQAVIEEFLSECALALSSPELGRYGVMSRDLGEIMRSAGKRVMYTPGLQMQGMPDLYDVFNTISLLRYEGAESIGGLLLAPQQQESVTSQLTLRNPVNLRDYRTVRKLLEISSSDLFLLCDGGKVYGLGSLKGDAAGDLSLISFTGHHSWRLVHAGKLVMEVNYGQPRLPEEKIGVGKFRQDITRTFTAMDEEALDVLWELVLEATRQKHGTMVVITPGAEAEAARLNRQGLVLEPTRLNPQLMRLITAIDGAVLIDLDNVCHAIGVILDGRASDKGDPSRGARYNSAVRYVASSDYPCLAIVVSEDGMIDLVSSSKL